MSTDTAPLLLVTGATGNTGRPLVDELVARGARVRLMVRSPAAAEQRPDGTEAVVADFDDADGLDRALAGVSAAYLVTPSSEQAEAQQLRFVDRAVAAGVTQIVLLSQLAAAEDSPVRFLRYHAVVERHIREAGLAYTFLRPNLFFQGLLAFRQMVIDHDVVSAPIGHARVSALDVRDIAGVAAAALTDPRHRNQTYTLTGPAAITHDEIAAALSRATGRAIGFVDADPQEFAASLTGILPDWQVGGLLEDYAHYAAGQAAEVTTAVRDVTGREPRSVHDFADDFADAFTTR